MTGYYKKGEVKLEKDQAGTKEDTFREEKKKTDGALSWKEDCW